MAAEQMEQIVRSLEVVPVQILLHGVEEIREALEGARTDVILPTGVEAIPADLQELILLTGVEVMEPIL
jgi:hypothetical protein